MSLSRATLLSLSASLLLSVPTLAKEEMSAQPSNNPIFGLWQTAKQEDENRTATVQVGPCASDSQKVCGTIIALEEPIDPETGKPKLDKKNPKKNLRQRPVMGLEILSGFEPQSDGSMEGGHIYSPRTGRTYSASLHLDGENKLKVTGYVFFFSKTQEWTRVENAPTKQMK